MPSSLPGYRYSEEEISYVLRRPRPHAVAPARRKRGTLLNEFFSFLEHHQLGVSLNLVLVLYLSHALFPNARQHTRKFFELSYYDDSTGKYAPGRDDWPFVLRWVAIFTGMRSAVMDYVLRPLAIRGGILKRKPIQRFSEQGWLILYYVLSFGIGMRLWTTSKYWLNLHELWTDFPDTTMTPLMKWYYLVQFGFWIQQIVVVNIEQRRKDYSQMLVHHVITCTLLFTSYSFYMTRVGNVILSLMDVADIILSSAKVLRYLAYRTACDVAFGIFIATWAVTRHIFYPIVLWSVWKDLPVIMPLGCYSAETGQKLTQNKGSRLGDYLQPFSEGGDVVCFDKLVHWQFLGLLTALECIALLWFAMIVRVAWKVVKGHGADDTRSDDEDEEEEVEATPVAANGVKGPKSE